MNDDETKEEACPEPEVYGPAAPREIPLIGGRFEANVRLRANGSRVARSAGKQYRRMMRKRVMAATTRPIDAELSRSRELSTAIRALAGNGHAARRLAKKERAFQRARRAEEARQLGLLKMMQAAQQPSSTGASSSPQPPSFAEPSPPSATSSGFETASEP